MRALRIWMLIALVLVLPLRGAMAAGLLCAPAGGAAGALHHGAGAPHHGAEATPHATGAAHHAAAMPHTIAPGGHGGHDSHTAALDSHPAVADMHMAVADTHGNTPQHQSNPCAYCAACCSITGLLGDTTPPLAQPPALQAPATLAEPAAHFMRDGPERPPRSS